MTTKRRKPMPWYRKGDQVVTAYALRAKGPGWANYPIFVIVREPGGKLREECIQPQDQTREMRVMFEVSVQAHLRMSAEAKLVMKGAAQR